MSKDYFSEFYLYTSGNVIEMEGVVNPEHANTLFATTGLENVQDVHLIFFLPNLSPYFML